MSALTNPCNKCGRTINIFEKYCDHCKKNLSLREKVIEGIRHDEIYGRSKTFDTCTGYSGFHGSTSGGSK